MSWTYFLFLISLIYLVLLSVFYMKVFLLTSLSCVTPPIFVLLLYQYDHRRPEAKILDIEVVKNEDNVKRVDDRALLNWEHSNLGLKNSNLKSPNLEGFNETKYITSAHKDGDAYKLNAFNQEASDRLSSDRSIPDTKHYK